MFASIPQDLRLTLRSMRQRPGPAVTCIVALALGLAANITVFGWIDNVLLQTVPGAAHPESLVALERISASGQATASPYPDLRDLQRGVPAIETMAGSHQMTFTVFTGPKTIQTAAYGQFVSAGFFPMLGVRPVLGRGFTLDEDRDVEGGYPYAVLSHRMWRERFNSDPAVIGSHVRINGRPVTIIGVAPAGFRGSFNGVAMDLWVHLSMMHLMGGAGSWQVQDRNAQPLIILGRLRRGATIEEAQSQTRAVSKRLSELYPATHAGSSVAVRPLWRSKYGIQGVLFSPLVALSCAALLLLMVACANVGHLLLARALARQPEYGLRLALGAGRGHLLAQMLMEGSVLSLAGTGVGFLIAMWVGDAMGSLLPSTNAPLTPFTMVMLNGRTAAFALALSALVTLVSGLIPARQVLRADIAGSLAESSRSISSRAAGNTRRALVEAEVALSLLALACAGLFVRGFNESAQAKLGFDPENVIAARLYLGSAGYSAEDETRFSREARRRLQDTPGVVAVTSAIELPLVGGGTESMEVEGYTPARGESMAIARNLIGPRYFRVLRIPMIAGAEFDERIAEGEPTVVVNRAFARRYLARREALGQRVRLTGSTSWSKVVGVVEDTRLGNPLSPPAPVVYAPFERAFASGHEHYLLLRTSGPQEQAYAAVRSVVGALASQDGLLEARPLKTHIEDQLFVLLATAALMSGLGVMALLLAGFGIHSVTTYAIGERRREIAVRMAVGARPAQVVRMVVGEMARSMSWGLAIGGVLALAAGRLLSSLLDGVSPASPALLFGPAVLLVLTALVAALVPAERATRIDPVRTLREK